MSRHSLHHIAAVAVLLAVLVSATTAVAAAGGSAGESAPSEEVAVWNGTADTAWYSEDGTKFTLTTAEQLAGLSQLVRDGHDFAGKTVLLDVDVSLEGHEWAPIGERSKTESLPFSGTFDGQGHSILKCSFAIDNAQEDGLTEYSGFFACVKDAEIRDFKLLDVDMKTNLRAGGVAGYIDAADGLHTDISGVTVSGKIVSTDDYAAAFALKVQGGSADSWNVKFEDCTTSAEINVLNGSKVAAFVGNNSCGVELVNCVNSGNVTVSNSSHSKTEAHAAGLVCYAQGCVKMTKCINSGNITSNNSQVKGGSGNVGGFIATTQSGSHYEFVDCVNAGNIIAERKNDSGGHFGGFIGRNNNGLEVLISGCRNTGNITVKAESGTVYAGRAIGYHDNYREYTESEAKVTIQDCSSLCKMDITGEKVIKGNMLGGVEDGYSIDVKSLTLTSEPGLPAVGADGGHEPTADHEGFHIPAKIVGAETTFYGTPLPKDLNGEVWLQQAESEALVQQAAAIDDQYFTDIPTALDAASTGKTVRILADFQDGTMVSAQAAAAAAIAADQQLVTVGGGRDISLDLNGHTVDANLQYLICGGAKLTVTGTGSIQLNDEEKPLFILSGENDDTEPQTGGAGHLVIDKEAEAKSSMTPVLLQSSATEHAGQARGATLDVYGKLAGDIYAVGVHSNVTEITEDCGKIVIHKGAALTGVNGPGMYLAGYADTTVEGGIITGKSGSGIEILAGNLTVTGGEIASSDESFSHSENNDGPSVTGAGIAVIKHTANLPVNVSVEGGKIEGHTGIYENSKDADLKISDGEVIGKGEDSKPIDTVNKKTGIVFGGHFSHHLEKELLDDSLNAELKSRQVNEDAPFSYHPSFDHAAEAAGEDMEAVIHDPEETESDYLVLIDPNITGGTVSSDKGYAKESTTVTLTVKPNDDMILDHLTVTKSDNGEVPVSGSSFVMPASGVRVTATFSAVQHVVTVEETEHGTLDVSPKNAETGSTVTVKPQPEDGWHLESLKVTNSSGKDVPAEKQPDGSWTFEMPQGGAKVSAEFAVDTHKVEVEVSDTEHGTLDVLPEAAAGETVTVTPSPAAGWHLESLHVKDSQGNDVPVERQEDGFWTFTMPEGGVTVSAVFARNSSSGGSSSSTRYDITVETAEHGSVKADRSKASYGQKVVLTAEADDGWELDHFSVKDRNGRDVEVKEEDSGRLYFTMPRSSVTVSAVFVQKTPAPQEPGDDNWFTDVPETAWYYAAVKAAYDRDLMDGVSSTLFSPDGIVTRAQFAQLLWNLEGRPDAGDPSFPDTSSDAWYADAVAWSQTSGVFAGYDSGLFGPDDLITREQMTAALDRYAAYRNVDMGSGADLSGFADASAVSSYAVQAMSRAVGAGLVKGVGENQLNPGGSASRAEAAQLIVRFQDTYSEQLGNQV